MIYLDNAAGTRPMLPLPDLYGNPSSPHAVGISAERQLNAATASLARHLQCREDEVLFVSGGTEANNLAILGVCQAWGKKGGTILTTPAQHPSVAEPLAALPPGFTVIAKPVDQWAAHYHDCVLAVLTHVHHETGDLYDLAHIAADIKKSNPSALVFADGAQGFCKEDACLTHVDLYSFSAHKFHGHTGTGGLMVRKNVKLKPLILGGGQQRGLRSGTQNVAGIVNMAQTADRLCADLSQNHAHVFHLKNSLLEITRLLPDVWVNQSLPHASPYILSLSFEGVKGEILVQHLSQQGVYASMGAACHTRKKDRLPLFALGFSVQRADSAVRFSLSHTNTLAEIDTAKAIILDTVARLRKIHARKR
jgi:cysteine desulfurase